MTEERKEEYLKIKEEIRRQLIGSMDFTREITDDELQGAIAERLRSRQFAGKLDIHERTKLGKELFFALRGLDILQELIEDEQVTEIMINGRSGWAWIKTATVPCVTQAASSSSCQCQGQKSSAL